MSTPEGVFERIVGALERVGIPYMLTGSFASGYHSSPRATQDIDLVIAPTAEQIRALVDLLPAEQYYLDSSSRRSARSAEGKGEKRLGSDSLTRSTLREYDPLNA